MSNTSSRCFKPECWSDSNWASDKSTRKSISGGLILVADCPIVWKSKQQESISLSSSEAEFIAAAEILKELIYVKSVAEHLVLNSTLVRKNRESRPGFLDEPTKFFMDNKSAISSAKSTEFKKLKHVHIRYLFLRDYAQSKYIDLEYINTKLMMADCLTKIAKIDVVQYFNDKLFTKN